MSLKTILDKKEKHIDALLAEFEKDLARSGKFIQANLKQLFKSGNFNKGDIAAVFDAAGLGEKGIGKVFVAKYDDLLEFGAEVSKELGTGFVLGSKSLSTLEKMAVNNLDKLTLNPNVISSLYDAALQYEARQMTFNQIVSFMEGKVTEVGRRTAAEAFTGITTYDRTFELEQYKQAGIERFFYVGGLIPTSRQDCIDVYTDPRNNTVGFTMAEIAALPVDFMTGGGFNCRHKFMAAVESIL